MQPDDRKMSSDARQQSRTRVGFEVVGRSSCDCGHAAQKQAFGRQAPKANPRPMYPTIFGAGATHAAQPTTASYLFFHYGSSQRQLPHSNAFSIAIGHQDRHYAKSQAVDATRGIGVPPEQNVPPDPGYVSIIAHLVIIELGIGHHNAVD